MSERNPLFSDRVYYEIISGCNLHCKHCSDLLSEQKNKMLSKERIIKFHKKMLDKFGICNSVVTGGEPALHPEFIPIVEELEKSGDVTITSNGTLLDIDMVEKLLKNRRVTLQLSIDGFSQETFDGIRGKGTHKKVYDLIEQIAERNLNAQVGVSMTMMQQNIDEVMQMISYCEKKELAYIYFPTLLPVGTALKKWDTTAPEVNAQKKIEDAVFEKIAMEKSKIPILSNRLDQICAKAIPENRTDCLSTFTIKVCPNELVMPCPVSSKTEHSLGNINDDDIAALIVENLNKIKIRKEEYRFQEKKCKECSIKNYCRGEFCANCSLMMDGLTTAKDYFCEVTKYHVNNLLEEVEENRTV